MWIAHPSFKYLVEAVWQLPVYGNPQFILSQKLKALKLRLKDWNKETFGYIKNNISAVESSILHLQVSMDTDPQESTKVALDLARSALKNLLQAEETHWKQKSRIRWLQEGDKNTRFFHLAAKIRGAKNRIDKVEFKGNTLENHAQIKSAAVEFFFASFTPSPAQLDPLLFQVQSKTVSILKTLFCK